ncbi:MAG TPA: zinc-binding alcohol dehydrogenase family protein [Candidatus Gallacutalibacter pullicola]|uniref:Zinc-binding alcohol dehydrogenase family protein n=1 Tax=Candidatus Gallacutalibacter pullicola TaxID=2840830 RepID=A0A9D1DSC6_9FIRM|nr:zinc-binding alcohol dehydrogenase family protein [Candidatus Gallacutalibacter pullicola]
MKAVQIVKPQQMILAELPEPQGCGAHEVKIRVKAAGICGSDIQIYRGTNPFAVYPRVIGHEFCGVVEETGEAVTRVSKGDHVAIDPVVSCGNCRACRSGRHNVCEKLEVIGVHRDGGFCDYIVLPEKNVYRADPSIPFDLLATAEPFSIGAQICWRGQVSQGDTVLIMGCGPIGLCTLQIARLRGARVIITDLLEERLERARDCGAEGTILISGGNLEPELDRLTDGEGPTVVIDTVCSPSSLEQAFRVSRPAGRVVVIGLTEKTSQIAQVDFTKKELTVTGSRLNRHQFGDVIRWMEEGKLCPEKLRSHVFPAQDAEKAFQLIQERPQEVCKVVLAF